MQDIAVMDTTCVIDVIHLLKDAIMLYHMDYVQQHIIVFFIVQISKLQAYKLHQITSK